MLLTTVAPSLGSSPSYVSLIFYALAILGVLGGAVSYFRGSLGQATIAQLETNNKVLKQTVDLQTEQITELKAQNQEQAGQLTVLREQVTQKAAVAELAKLSSSHHSELMEAIGALTKALSNNIQKPASRARRAGS
jgi:hypothetical protein